MSARFSRRKNTTGDQALPNDGARIVSALQLVGSDLGEPIGMQLDEEHVALFVLTKKR